MWACKNINQLHFCYSAQPPSPSHLSRGRYCKLSPTFSEVRAVCGLFGGWTGLCAITNDTTLFRSIFILKLARIVCGLATTAIILSDAGQDPGSWGDIKQKTGRGGVWGRTEKAGWMRSKIYGRWGGKRMAKNTHSCIYSKTSARSSLSLR